jgi:P pilus assembly chaperone PapD
MCLIPIWLSSSCDDNCSKKVNNLVNKRYVIIIILAVLLLFVIVCPVLAGGLTVSGGKIDDLVSPANDYSYTMKVENNSDAPMDVGVQVKGYGMLGDSAFIALEPAEDNSPYTGRELLTVYPDSFRLEPSDSQIITIVVKIPSEIGDGGRYAIVFIHTVPPKDSMVATISAVAARVLLTIEGSKLIHRSELSTPDLKLDKSLEALVILTNTGNHHYKPKVLGTIKKGDKVLATASIDDGWPIIPGYSRQFKLSFVNTEMIPADEYEIDITVMDDSGNLAAQHSSTITLDKPYSAASPITTALVPYTATTLLSTASMIIPSTASILKTSDDKISISFPKGAVTGQATVSLQSYPIEKLNSPPTGFQLAAICFRIDGLTGLLAKEATVKVQYSPADLEKAGGDASRLKLARWDEGDNQWSILNTTVDRNNMTLTATTNRFSIWSVMVAPTVKINLPLIIGGSMGGLIIVCLAVLYVIKRRK